MWLVHYFLMYHIRSILNVYLYVRFTLVNKFLLINKYYVYNMHKGNLTNIKIYESKELHLKLKNYRFFDKCITQFQHKLPFEIII